MNKKTRYLSSTLCALSTIILGIEPTLAQNTQQQQASAQNNQANFEGILLEEIIVTARRRDELLLETPVTITALTDKFIKDAQIEDTFGLANFTPGLTFEDLGVRFSSKPVIRGLTTNSITPSQQKNSSFIDGFYVAGASSTLPPIAYKQIEVLKGPQSAAFGRGTFSGAINYITHDPDDEVNVRIETKVAQDAEYGLSVLADGPLVKDKLYGQLIAHYDTWDGNDEWVNTDGVEIGNRESKFGMGKLVWNLNENVELKLTGILSTFSDGPLPLLFATPDQRNGVFPGGNFPVGEVTLPDRPYASDFSVIPNPGVETEKTRLSAELTWEMQNHQLSLSGAYNKEDSERHVAAFIELPCRAIGRDLSSTGAQNDSCSRTDSLYEDTQLGIRLSSSSDSALQYLFGVSYIDLQQDQVIYQPVTGSIFFWSEGGGGDYESWSVYGSASYDVTDRLTLGFEGRYNDDTLEVDTFPFCRSLGLNGVPSDPPCARAFTGIPDVAPTIVREESFTKFLPRLTLDYKLSDRALLYALYSEGNQPGSFNSRFVADEFQVIEEENLANYELGIKTSTADGRLTSTVSAFYMEWSDQVFRRTFQTILPGDTSPSFITANVNQGDSEILGLEAEVFYQATAGLDLRGTLAYTQAEYKNFCSNFLFLLQGIPSPGEIDCVSVNGNQLETQPEWQASLSANYTESLGDTGYNWFIRGDYAFQSTKYASEMNLAETGDSNILNARIGIRNDKYTFELYANNLTDEDSPTRLARLNDITNLVSSPGTGTQSVAAIARRSSQVGIRVSANF